MKCKTPFSYVDLSNGSWLQFYPEEVHSIRLMNILYEGKWKK